MSPERVPRENAILTLLYNGLFYKLSRRAIENHNIASDRMTLAQQKISDKNMCHSSVHSPTSHSNAMRCLFKALEIDDFFE